MEGTLPIRIQSQCTVSQYPFYFPSSYTLGKISDIKEFDRYLFFSSNALLRNYIEEESDNVDADSDEGM